MPVTKMPRGIKRKVAFIGRRASIPYARATASLRMLPDFLIVGAQRAGTTSLYNYLAEHPDVGRVRLSKGVHYFDMHYTRPMSWYRSHFPLDPKKVPFKRRPNHVGEGAPYYMFHPVCGERIVKALPGVKVIAILRDPIERAQSQWAHETARAFETLPFREALEAEAGRLAGEEERLRRDPAARSHAHQHQSYLARSQYAPQVERLWATYGKDRVMIIHAAKLFAEPSKVYADTLAFLGLSPFEATYEVHNARSYSKIDAETAAWLDEHLRESNTRLVELLGPEFDFRRHG